MRTAASREGLGPSQQIDRHWFRSVYARGHGGVLCEFATAGAGYTTDEPLDDLGGRLVLPRTFEDRRDQIKADYRT